MNIIDESDSSVLNCLKEFKNIRREGMNLQGQQGKREETLFTMERQECWKKFPLTVDEMNQISERPQWYADGIISILLVSVLPTKLSWIVEEEMKRGKVLSLVFHLEDRSDYVFSRSPS